MIDPRTEGARRNPRRTRKVCSVCRQEKPLQEYHLGGSVVDGHSATCKVCAIARTKNWYRLQPVRINPAAYKWCPACQRTLPGSSFALARRLSTGLQTECKDCHRQLARGTKVIEIRRRLGKPTDRTRITQAYPKVNP